jgi:homoserine kinase
MRSFLIQTPCSSANIGPGFDVIGLALSLHLELKVTVDDSKTSSELPLNCQITYEDLSKSTEQISLDPEVNLITRVALYVLRCHNQRAFPVETKVHISNPIPLGRGLGSSGTAVVAGVMLGNAVGNLGLSKERLLDYCLMIGESFPVQLLNSMEPGPIQTQTPIQIQIYKPTPPSYCMHDTNSL